MSQILAPVSPRGGLTKRIQTKFYGSLKDPPLGVCVNNPLFPRLESLTYLLVPMGSGGEEQRREEGKLAILFWEFLLSNLLSPLQEFLAPKESGGDPRLRKIERAYGLPILIPRSGAGP